MSMGERMDRDPGFALETDLSEKFLTLRKGHGFSRRPIGNGPEVSKTTVPNGSGRLPRFADYQSRSDGSRKVFPP